MLLVLLIMIAGIITGVFIHHKPALIKVNDQLISVAIYVLLFLLGVSVGLNKTIIQNIGTLGFQALIITLGAVTGSVLVSWLIYKAFFQGKQNINTQDEE
ncbi:MAG: LysO family transporter [Verrucomicrobia bacterium]|nr:LysO family transporter [Prolixibacteraceae bacterium]